MPKTVFVLIKVGRKEHLQQFRESGLLYMQSLEKFREFEKDSARGDSFEGCDTITQPKDIADFTFENPVTGRFTIPGSELAGPIRIARTSTASCNVYCMFALTAPIDRGFDPRLLEFPNADSLVAVFNPTEFLRRVSLAAEKQNWIGKCGLVEYYDQQQYSGEVGVFRKRNVFAYQQEFRFVVWPGSAEPKLLYSGNLTDITSEVVSRSEANEKFDFSTRSAQEAGLSW